MSLSRSAFWHMLHNVIVLRTNKSWMLTKTEPEVIVKGVHEGIIPEDLFDQVQLVASGKKMIKAKPKKVSEALPMRGF